MSYKNKKIFLSLLLLAFEVLPADDNSSSFTQRLLGAIGQSNMMHYYATNIQSKIEAATIHVILNSGNEPASQEYQELSKQVQFAVGIPQERHVPIKNINPQSPLAARVCAVAATDAIYVNEENLNAATYGIRRCALLHEAIHIKYHDMAMYCLCKCFGLCSTTFATYAGLKLCKIASWNKSISLIAGIKAASYLSAKYDYFREKRADTQGHLATQCIDCITEVVQERKQLFEVEDHPLKNTGYLWAAELEKIAQNFDGKKCQYHAQKAQFLNMILSNQLKDHPQS